MNGPEPCQSADRVRNPLEIPKPTPGLASRAAMGQFRRVRGAQPSPRNLMKIAAISLAAVLTVGITSAGVFPAGAQGGADPVLARVDGTEIRESDLALAESDIGSALQSSPPEARREALITYLIDVTIIAK